MHTENQGSGPARNVGIAESRGRYLYFPDADDYIEPNAISILVDAMCNGKYDLVVFGYKCVAHEGVQLSVKEYESYEARGDAIRSDYKEFFGMSNKYSIQGAPWNKFFDGETVRMNNIQYPPLRRHQDEGFISRYMCVAKSVRFIPDVLYTYYPNTASIEWKKYPVDYIDAVLGLRDVWDNTILSWNKNDTDTNLMVRQEIFSKTIKALELSYSPKMNLKFFSRIKWISKICKRSDIKKYDFKICGSLYQKCILFLSK